MSGETVLFRHLPTSSSSWSVMYMLNEPRISLSSARDFIDFWTFFYYCHCRQIGWFFHIFVWVVKNYKSGDAHFQFLCITKKISWNGSARDIFNNIKSQLQHEKSSPLYVCTVYHSMNNKMAATGREVLSPWVEFLFSIKRKKSIFI